MFKYPAPWQVLCGSLERREQVPENEGDGSPTLSNLVKENIIEEYVTDSKAFPIEVHQILSTSESPAHKVLEGEVADRNNISEREPKATAKHTTALQETHTHAYRDKSYVPEEQGANLADSLSSATESTMDRVTRKIYSSISSSTQSINGSQQDLANFSEENQTTEKRDVWISPPDRRLKVLKEEERFEIRTHLPETSPTRLFVDSDSDDDYKVPSPGPRSHELTPEKVLELEKKRKDIIKKQGQRRSSDTEDMINISDQNVSLIDEVNGQNKPNIHTEQIQFEVARQQFLKLEKERNSLPIMPRPQSRQSRLSTHSLHDNHQVAAGQERWEGRPHEDEYTITQEITGKNRNSSFLRKQFFKSFSVDSLDDGDQETPADEIEEQSESIPNPNDETPIEREIRLALQREESLRKERGILSSGETKEIIEISKNPVLPYLSDMPRSKSSKNRPHTSLFIQREIEKEVQREADLKSEGRVAGLYDKGESQELDKRRKFFEQPDEIPVQPLQSSGTKMIPKETTDIVKRDTSDLPTDKDSKNCTDVDSPQPYSVRMKWRPAPFNAYRNRRLSADNILDIKTPENESSEETYVLHKENFSLQPLKFRLNVQENDGEIESDNKIGHRERFSTRLRPSLNNIIEQEIQQTLERDRELEEERRKAGLPPLTIPKDTELNTPHNGCDVPGDSSLTSDESNSSPSAPWKGTLGNKSPSYEISTVKMFRTHGYPKFEVSASDGDRLKRHENRVLSGRAPTPSIPVCHSYAGIDPSDVVNTEIVESTRVNRHKNTMALRWEAGLYANDKSD